MPVRLFYAASHVDRSAASGLIAEQLAHFPIHLLEDLRPIPPSSTTHQGHCVVEKRLMPSLAPAPISRGIKHEHGGNAKAPARWATDVSTLTSKSRDASTCAVLQPIWRVQGLLQHTSLNHALHRLFIMTLKLQADQGRPMNVSSTTKRVRRTPALAHHGPGHCALAEALWRPALQTRPIRLPLDSCCINWELCTLRQLQIRTTGYSLVRPLLENDGKEKETNLCSPLHPGRRLRIQTSNWQLAGKDKQALTNGSNAGRSQILMLPTRLAASIIQPRFCRVSPKP